MLQSAIDSGIKSSGWDAGNRIIITGLPYLNICVLLARFCNKGRMSYSLASAECEIRTFSL